MAAHGAGGRGLAAVGKGAEGGDEGGGGGKGGVAQLQYHQPERVRGEDPHGRKAANLRRSKAGRRSGLSGRYKS